MEPGNEGLHHVEDETFGITQSSSVSRNSPNHKRKSEKKSLETTVSHSCIRTMLMRLLKEKGIYEMSQEVAERINISQQKIFLCIAMRFGLLINHCLLNENFTKIQVVKYIFGRLTKDLEMTVRSKYKKSDEDFIKKAIETCEKKIMDFRRAISLGLDNKNEVPVFLKELYSYKKNLNNENTKRIEEMTNILIGTAKFGKKFGLEGSSLTEQEERLFNFIFTEQSRNIQSSAESFFRSNTENDNIEED